MGDFRDGFSLKKVSSPKIISLSLWNASEKKFSTIFWFVSHSDTLKPLCAKEIPVVIPT